jgi:hypothetical protein
MNYIRWMLPLIHQHLELLSEPREVTCVEPPQAVYDVVGHDG